MNDAPLSRDLRDGGRWSLAQRAKNDVLCALALSAIALGRLPRPLLRGLGSAAGHVLHVVAPSLRRVARRQIARALPDRDAVALTRACFAEMGRQLADALAIASRGQCSTLEFADADRATLQAALDEGRGVVLASAHLGPFESVARTLAAACPITVVARESYDPRLMRIYARLRPYRTVYRGAPAAGVRMLRVLRSGGVLGIPMDLRTRAESVPAPFLGIDEAPTAVGPARLALRTGACVVVATTSPGRSAQQLAVTVSRVETDDLTACAEDEITLTRRINEELARRIIAMPTMWPWMHARAAQSFSD